MRALEAKYRADVDWLADLIPRVPCVVSQRYTGQKREVWEIGVGAPTEDAASLRFYLSFLYLRRGARLALTGTEGERT